MIRGAARAGAGIAVSIGTGYLVVRAPIAAAVLVLGLCATVVFAFDRERVAIAGLMILPWLVVFGSFMPPLVKTLATGAVVVLLLLATQSVQLGEQRVLAIAGSVLFLLPIIVSLLSDHGPGALALAAKLAIFPVMVLAAISPQGRELLRRGSTAVLGSGAAALAVHLGIIGAGLGAGGSYYNAGERFGFIDPGGPHEFALLALVIAAAGAARSPKLLVQLGYLVVGGIAAIATGVRSGLLSLVVLAGFILWRGRLGLRSVVLVAALGAALSVSGVTSVLSTRETTAQSQGQSSALGPIGSARGTIWQAALRHFGDGGPSHILVGTGANTIPKFEFRELGDSFVAHSDVVQSIVELGVVGFLGLVLLWLALLRGGGSAWVLTPLLVFGAVNGSLEYVTAVVVGVALAAGASPGVSRVRQEDVSPRLGRFGGRTPVPEGA